MARPDTKYPPGTIDEIADEMIEWIKKKENLWLKNFFNEKKIVYSVVDRFKVKSSYFAEQYELAMQIQEGKIVIGSLNKKLSEGMSRFTLMNNHGWVNKNENKISGDSENPLACIISEIDGTTAELVNDRDKTEGNS